MTPVSERSPILLLDGATRETVAATLVDGVSAEEVRAADAAWKPFSAAALRAALARAVPPEDLPGNWEWERKMRAATPASRFFGIECAGEMQALMAIRMDKIARLPEQAGLPLVYVDYLAAAPWNQPILVSPPRYRGAGTVMMTAAIQASRETGWEGRLGLHSLRPAETFYRDACGMTDMGIDSAYESLRYFERTAAQPLPFSRR